MLGEPARHERCHTHRRLKMRFEQIFALINIGRHLIFIPRPDVSAFGHECGHRTGDVERNAAATFGDAAVI